MAGKWWEGWHDGSGTPAAQAPQKSSDPDEAKRLAYSQALGRDIAPEDWAKIQSANRRMVITEGSGKTGADGYGETVDRKDIGVDFNSDPKRGTEAINRFYNQPPPVQAQPAKAEMSGSPPWAPPPAATYSGFEGASAGPGESAVAGQYKPWVAGERPGMNALYDQPKDTYVDPKTGKVIEMGSSAQPGYMAKLDQTEQSAMAPYQGGYNPAAQKSPLGPDPFAAGYQGNVKTSGLDSPSHMQFEPDKITAKAPGPENPWPGEPMPKAAPSKGSHFSKAEDPWGGGITAQNAPKYSAELDALEKKAMAPYAKPKSSLDGDSERLDSLEKKALAPYKSAQSPKPSFGKAVASKKAKG